MKEFKGINLENLAIEIKKKIPFSFPEIELRFQLTDIPNTLSGHTLMRKEKDKLIIVITIHITESLFDRPNISNAIKIVLAHEFCHVVNPSDPDSVMKKHLREMWKVWSKAKSQNALECSHKVTFG